MTFERMTRNFLVTLALVSQSVTGQAEATARKSDQSTQEQTKTLVDGAIDDFRAAKEVAYERLQAAFQVQQKKLEARSKLSLEEVRKLRDEIAKGLSEFVEGGVAFEFARTGLKKPNRKLKSACKDYDKDIHEALQNLREQYDDARSAYEKTIDKPASDEQVEFALALKDEVEGITRKFGPPPPVPKFVRQNVGALRKHRPKFCSDFETEFDNILTSAKKKDRRAFRTALNRASEATKNSNGKAYVKEDVLVVLAALRRGESNLKEINVNKRRGRGKKPFDVEYGSR